MSEEEPKAEVLPGQKCPMCNKDTLTLTESEKEIAYFGKVFIFSMTCSSCNYHKADLECAENNGPIKYTFEINSEEDMKVRVVKSSEGTIKIPRVGSIEPGAASNGYITNIEGVLNRIKHQIEQIRDASDDKAEQKKAKNLIKKLTKIMWGQEPCKITIEDPTGNSAIISDKAVKGK